MKFIFYLTFFTVISIFSSPLFPQCSDAGVCQIGQLTETEGKKFIDISAQYRFGQSDEEEDVNFHSFRLNTMYYLLENSSLQISVPYNLQNGPLASTSGIGDLIFSFNQQISFNQNSSLDLSIGAKLATGSVTEGEDLQMVYQPGLGSNDLLFSAAYSYNNFNIGAGYQIAGSRNDNFLKLKRGDDLLLRASYEFSLNEFNILPQLLFIKRLSESSIQDPAFSTGRFVEIDGSDQSQLNLMTSVNYDINNSYGLYLEFAIPFLEREVNVDGLTRKFSSSLGVKYSFY